MGEKNKIYQNFQLDISGVTGFGTLRFDKGNAIIAYIKVDDDLKGTGIGRKSVLDIEKMAKENGMHKITGEAKQGSELFWEKMGYTITPRKIGRSLISKKL